MLGIFDSGLGGLTVLQAVRALLPDVDIVYYADQAHVPYGDRTTGELERLLSHNVAYLEARGVDCIVMGCNTSCAIAAASGWPPAHVPILDLIAGAAEEVTNCGARRVGIVGTAATIRSGAYGRAIRARDKGIDVQEIAAPALVPLVEAGVLVGPVARNAVAEVCSQFSGELHALVLACTHYPFLDAHFAAVLGDVARIDPARVQARRAATLASGRAARGDGHIDYVTTGSLEAYRRAVHAIVGPTSVRASFAIAPALDLTAGDAIPLPCP